MNAYELIASWTEERVRDLNRAAAKAEGAYTKNPMAGACSEYAAALRTAANVLDEHRRAFAERGGRSGGPAR